MPETLQVAPLTRQLDLDDFRVRKDGDVTRLTFSASSEYAVERYFGKEVLDHSPDSIRLGRANNGSLPLLFNHRMDDVIGMVDSMKLDGKRLMCEAHLFETERGREVQAMLDGGLRNVSIRYRIHTVEVQKNGDERVIDWEPLEQSIVSIPADPTVGLGRAEDGEQAFEVARVRAPELPADTAANPLTNEGNEMSKEDNDTAERGEDGATAGAQQTAGDSVQPQPPAAPQPTAQPAVQVRSPEPSQGPEIERKRQEGIRKLCQINKIDDNTRDYWIGAGLTLDQVADDLLTIIEERGETNPKPLGEIGLTRQEAQRFSLSRAINAAIDKDWKLAPFELECSRAVQQKLNKPVDAYKFYVPFEVMQDQRVDPRIAAQRDLTAGTAGAGGYLVETSNMGFIEMLRNRSVAFRMGARRLSGLVGDVAVPRQSAAATAYWLSTEATQITESQQVFVQMALTPKTVGAYTEISRQLLLQSSPDAEGIVISDLAAVTALAADLAVLNGSGASGQPTGILQTSGIGSVTGTSIDYDAILEHQTDVAEANVMPDRGGYVTTPAVAKLLMTRARFANTDTPLWDGNIWNGTVSGFPGMSSNQMPAATSIFGDWQEVVVGEWGVLEVEVNPYANFQAGIIGVRAMYSMDVGVRRPFAFTSAASIT